MKCSAQANKKSTGQMASRKQRALQGISGMVWRGRRELSLSEKAQSKEIKDGKSLLCHYLGEGGVCQAPEISTWLEGDCSAVGGRGGVPVLGTVAAVDALSRERSAVPKKGLKV